ncbi:Ig and FN3 domain-containing protein, partial [Salmonella sp. s51090]|uniref:Ig and FN3 domain-containing protein n=1 Tax=Salmonella sp. s51090 TaxID=3159651 RepID=UPI003980B22B
MLKLRVSFTGIPRPTISWEHNGRDRVDGGRFEMKDTERDTILSISRITNGDAGKYTVIAVNELGIDRAHISINILRHPDPPRNLEVTDISTYAVRLYWQPPFYDGGNIVTSYMVVKLVTG